MVKIRPKSMRKPHIAPDLSTKMGRARAYWETYGSDHGFLRVYFQNLHQISPKMWRGNQPSPSQVFGLAKKQGIKTIINLRGVSTKGYFGLEKEACAKAGITLESFQVFSRDMPSKAAIWGAKALFDRIPYPAYMHCKSGADRAGIMSVLYMLLHEEVDFTTARAQLSWKYLHLKHGKTGMLDHFFDSYAAYNTHTPMSFLDWVDQVYDPVALKAEFLTGFKGGIAWDKLIGRE